ncbi:hypothetical protein LCGC14_1483470 [marine sediment metagenome]|uniref:Uncharacterized protein n=1 Tax=marine sediment metagenome TaxID=412755 RepID=A0A0F9J9G3_9ZZZZ
MKHSEGCLCLRCLPSFVLTPERMKDFYASTLNPSTIAHLNANAGIFTALVAAPNALVFPSFGASSVQKKKPLVTAAFLAILSEE